MLPRRRKGNVRYNPRYERKQVTDDIPRSLKRKPTAYTMVSPEVRKQEEKQAKEAENRLCCPHCGAEIKKSQKYCPACGQVLKED